MSGVMFDQLSVGQSVRDATTITETHLVLAAGVFKDFNPVHTDESFAAASRFGTRVVHGMLTAGMMIGVLGSYLGAGALALVEQQLRFVGAVHPGDTVATEWTVEALEPKPRLREGGGLVEFRGTCRKVGGADTLGLHDPMKSNVVQTKRSPVVIEGTCKFLVRGAAPSVS